MTKHAVYFTDDTSMIEWLLAERARQGLSAQEMAESIGVFVSTLRDVESGSLPPPLRFFSAAAAVLGYRLNVEFVPKEDEPHVPE